MNLRTMGKRKARFLHYGSPSGLENSKLLPGVKVPSSARLPSKNRTLRSTRRTVTNTGFHPSTGGCRIVQAARREGRSSSQGSRATIRERGQFILGGLPSAQITR
jgi:hypothetical protein